MANLVGTSANATPGVEGDNTDTSPANGVFGHAICSGGSGVFGQNSSPSGYGVAGNNSSSSGGGGAAIYGFTANAAVTGVFGQNTGGGVGVYGNSTGPSQGVKGDNNSTGTGVFGYNSGTGKAVYGSHAASSGAGFGVYGESGSNSGYGVYGSNSGNGGTAISGNVSTGGIAVSGVATGGQAFSGSNNSATNATLEMWNTGGGPVASFHGSVGTGDLSCGNLTKTSGTFAIDHPLDPVNKDLFHSFVESPEMKNIYDGEAVAGETGEAVVVMPGYFDALNCTFRYQLTAIGAPAPNLHIKRELRERRFVIAGANAHQKICWQVTGVRKDAYALAHPIEVEKEKSPEKKGFYRNPIEHGQPESMGIAFQQLLARGRPNAKRNGAGAEEPHTS